MSDHREVPHDRSLVLTLAPEVAHEVLVHATETLPDECCGILLGPHSGHATIARRAKNVHDAPRTRYLIAPEDLAAALDEADTRGLDVVGFYHSHPRGYAAFSDEDKARGSWEGAAYLLVSLSPLTFVAGRWERDDFVELFVRVPGGEDAPTRAPGS